MLNKIKKRFFQEKNNGEKLVQRTGLRISTNDRIRQMVRHELFRQQVNNEAESFEEADDFDLPDGEEWISPYENEFEPEPVPPTPADPPSPEPGKGPGAAPEPVNSNDPVPPDGPQA